MSYRELKFELALEKTELQPEEVWYIGAIDVKYKPKEDILTIKNWKELIDLIMKLD